MAAWRRARHCAASNLKALYFLKGISLDFFVWYEALGMRSGQVGQLLAIGPGMALVFFPLWGAVPPGPHAPAEDGDARDAKRHARAAGRADVK